MIDCPKIMYSDSEEQIHYDQSDFPLYLRSGRIENFLERKAKPHYHEDIEYIALLSGSMSYDVNGEKIPLRKGEGIFVNSKALHFGFAEKDENCEFLCLLFSPLLLSANKGVEDTLLNPYLSSGQSFLFLPKNAKPLQTMKALWQIKQAGADRLSYLSLLFSLWQQTLPYFKPLGQEKPSPSLQRVKSLMAYLKNNYSENVTLTSISKAMMLSPSEINKLSRLYLHQSPMHYLIDYRLDKAANALKTTDLSVEEIAFSCGYSSPSFFIRSFKRKYQKTPFAYRLNK
jgi:AraC-like DNA-binding protein